MRAMFQTNDTIAAISSAAGEAGRSIVRLSGEQAIELGGRIFAPPLAELAGFRYADGVVTVRRPELVKVPARAYLFRAPRSYTRQDVLELHVPAEVVAAMAIQELLSAGARQAQPGEFTARAFLHGRLDLSAAEAVADVIDAQADAELRSAVGVLEGALGRLCGPAAQTFTQALALVEASIDFAEEQIELARPAELAEMIRASARQLEQALAHSGRWLGSGHQPQVAIAGRPNAGKSSLLNALSGVERAIVSAMAGTTRDVLSAPATLPGGLEVMLLDAAGLDASVDPLSRATHQAARQAVASAEAVLFIFEAAADDNRQDLALLEEVRLLNPRAPLLVVGSKIDLVEASWIARPQLGLSQSGSRDLQSAIPRVLPVSAKTGQGLDSLREELAELLSKAAAPRAEGLLLHDRQRQGVSQAAQSAVQAATLLAASAAVSDVAELAAVDLRACLDSLGGVTGKVFSEDILASIFARFCIGK